MSGEFMSAYGYRLLNVFALEGQPLTGNPLCVFEDARGLDDATMQALALQFNLSETTFILYSEVATARVRIFTPNFELPFAGHPTLGTAQVVRELHNAGDKLTLETKAGIIPLSAERSMWTLQANAPRWRAVEATAAQFADMLDLNIEDLSATPLWVDTGTEQLIIPLATADAVQRCNPKLELLRRYASLNDKRFMAYVWAPDTAGNIAARFFFAKGSLVVEDPATGSACANLGGWFVATQNTLPLTRKVYQGSAVGRPSALTLKIDAQSRIFVSGIVIELARGVVTL